MGTEAIREEMTTAAKAGFLPMSTAETDETDGNEN